MAVTQANVGGNKSLSSAKAAASVVSNRPFCLFCESVAPLVEHSKQLSIIGSNTNQEVFKLIKEDKPWQRS